MCCSTQTLFGLRPQAFAEEQQRLRADLADEKASLKD